MDLVRGAVMILMAIDHVRVYSGIPAGGPTPGVFFTRWITHFCAPAFVFLAGTSAFLYARTHADVSRHLLIRGLWLVFLELTFLRVAWTFNFGLLEYQMAGVLWVIGWCMVLMAVLVKLPERILAAVGLVIVAGHNVFDPFLGARMAELSDSRLSGLWKVLYLSFYANVASGALDQVTRWGHTATCERGRPACRGRSWPGSRQGPPPGRSGCTPSAG